MNTSTAAITAPCRPQPWPGPADRRHDLRILRVAGRKRPKSAPGVISAERSTCHREGPGHRRRWPDAGRDADCRGRGKGEVPPTSRTRRTLARSSRSTPMTTPGGRLRLPPACRSTGISLMFVMPLMGLGTCRADPAGTGHAGPVLAGRVYRAGWAASALVLQH